MSWFSDLFDFVVSPNQSLYAPPYGDPIIDKIREYHKTTPATWSQITYTVPAKKSVTYHPASYSKRWKK